MNYYIEDEEFGRVMIRVDARARKFVFRMRSDGVHVTMPPGVSEKELRRALNDVRPKLVVSQAELKEVKLMDQDYRIDAELFKVYVVQGTMDRFLAQSKLGEVKIVCPPEADFANDSLQAWLQKVIVEAMRKNAKAVLLPRLSELAEAHHFQYASVKINSSRGRWGSCSGRKNINLSCYLMLLPTHLIDYVLLHELCHTVEMNHSDHFWTLMNQVTDGKAYVLREELKAFKGGAEQLQ